MHYHLNVTLVEFIHVVMHLLVCQVVVIVGSPVPCLVLCDVH